MALSQSYQNSPAIKDLLAWFSRWQRDDEAYHGNVKGETRFLEDHQLDPIVPLPIPATIKFLTELTKVDVLDLPDEDGTCFICTKPYTSLVDRHLPNANEVAIRLNCCRNTVGYGCLFKWLDPFTKAANVSCPFCRRTLFHKFASINTIQGKQARVDAIDWAIRVRPDEAQSQVKRLTLRLKTRIVKHYISEAYRDLEEMLRSIGIDVSGDREKAIQEFREKEKAKSKYRRDDPMVDFRVNHLLVEYRATESLLFGIELQVQMFEARNRPKASENINEEMVQRTGQVLHTAHLQERQQEAVQSIDDLREGELGEEDMDIDDGTESEHSEGYRRYEYSFD